MPQAPVQVWLFTPASPKAGGLSVAAVLPSGRNALPSRFSSASNLPGPQPADGFLDRWPRRSASSLDEGAQVGRRGDDRADVEVAIGPAVEPVANAGRVGVVDGRMAQRALDADDLSVLPSSLKKPVTPTTALALSRTSVLAGSLRSTLPALDGGRDVFRHRVDIDFQAELERLFRAEPRPHSAELLARDRLVQLDRPPRSPRCRTCRNGRFECLQPASARHCRGRLRQGWTEPRAPCLVRCSASAPS